MNIELERKEIIEELQHVNDEWVLKAIRRLLCIDYDDDGPVPDDHKRILDERISEYESGKTETIPYEEVKKRLNAK